MITKLSLMTRNVMMINISCVRQSVMVGILLITLDVIFSSIFRFSFYDIGKPCVLPWKNGNETNWYYGCAEPAANRPWNDEKWCPTEVDGNKRFNPWTNYNWNNNWGYCEDICLDTSSKYSNLLNLLSEWTTVTTWVNVFAFKNNDGPRLYIHKDKLLHFCSSVSGNSNLCFNFEYQNNQKYHIVIKQYPKQISQTCTSYIYEIEIDGKQEYSIENTKPQEFENVKLYASHPSHIPFTSEIGLLQNLQIEQGNKQICCKYFDVVLY